MSQTIVKKQHLDARLYGLYFDALCIRKARGHEFQLMKANLYFTVLAFRPPCLLLRWAAKDPSTEVNCA